MFRLFKQCEGAVVVLGDCAGEAETNPHAETEFLGGEEGFHQMGFEVILNAGPTVCYVDNE
jgi:hypothetical protein